MLRSNSRQWLRSATARPTCCEHARMELVGEVADRLRQRDRARLQPSDLLAQLGRRVGREAASERAQGDRQRRQLLIRVVVERRGRCGGAPPPGRTSAGRPGRGSAASLSCAARSARCRASAWAKTSARSRSRADQLVGPVALLADRADRRGSRAPTPPSTSGTTAIDRVPSRRALAVDRRLIGQIRRLRETDDVTLTELRDRSRGASLARITVGGPERPRGSTNA